MNLALSSKQEQLFKQYLPYVEKLALKYSKFDAADISSISYEALAKAIYTYDKTKHKYLSTWISFVFTRCMYTYTSSIERTEMNYDENFVYGMYNYLSRYTNDIENIVDFKYTVKSFLNSFPEKLRYLIELRLQGFTVEESIAGYTSKYGNKVSNGYLRKVYYDYITENLSYLN